MAFSSLTPPDLRIVMLGKTGSGKSSLGNAILKGNVFDTRGLSESTTMRVQRKRGWCFEKRTEIVDTPGVYGTYNSHQETALEIAKAMNPAPHVILYVIKLDTFTDEDSNTFRRIKKYFNNNITDHMIVVITTRTEPGPSLEEFYTEATSNLRRIIEEVNKRCFVVNTQAEYKDSSDLLCSLSLAVNRLTARTKGKAFYMKSRDPEDIKENVKAAERIEVANTQTGRHLQDQIKQREDQIKQREDQTKRLWLFGVIALLAFCLALIHVFCTQDQNGELYYWAVLNYLTLHTFEPNGTLLS